MTTLIKNLLFSAVILANLTGCTLMNGQETIAEAEHLLTQGELTKVAKIAGYILKTKEFSPSEKAKADSVLELCDRIRKDFSLSDSDVLRKLVKYDPNVTTKDLLRLEETSKIDVRLLDGQKRYFKNCVSNLFLLDQAWMNKKNPKEDYNPDSFTVFKLSHIASIIEKSDSSRKPVDPVRMKLSYTIRVQANCVPAGEIIRCWMPYPRENHERQTDINLISTDPAIHLVSPSSDLQRSVYMEKIAVANEPAEFHTEIEFTSMAQTFQLTPEMIRPYQKKSPLYKENTSERPPQIVFNSNIKSLAKNILQGETNPLLQVRKIYRWINDSVTWASALEYSIMPDIPGFVMEHRHGDCGMQTLLFMALVRYAGIPAKWQSGWMLHPKEVNLHDWCEVYYEGTGWVPVDQSFGLQKSPDPKIRDFYSSGIDSYRLIVNDDFSQSFTPRKKYFRSEPYDFQRGEVEWKGGNLYFDKWSWHMDVSYK
jgi:hypothetical protein